MRSQHLKLHIDVLSNDSDSIFETVWRFPRRTIHLRTGADAHFTLIYLMYSYPRLADSDGASRPALRKHHLACGWAQQQLSSTCLWEIRGFDPRRASIDYFTSFFAFWERSCCLCSSLICFSDCYWAAMGISTRFQIKRSKVTVSFREGWREGWPSVAWAAAGSHYPSSVL